MTARFLLFLAASAALMLGCCAAPSPTERQQLAVLLGATERPVEAEGYSAFLVGRFAALTNDPVRAQQSYEAALSVMPDSPELAERAVYSALLAGDFNEAVRLSRYVEDPGPETSALVRLTLGVDAVENRRLVTADRLLSEESFGQFNAAIASSLRAWIAFERDGVESALAALEDSGGNAMIDALSQYTRAMILVSAERDSDALAILESLWQSGPRLAVAVEAQARLMAQAGRASEAAEIIAEFRNSLGPNPALDRLRARIEADEAVAVNRPDLREGAALAIYMPAAALAAQSSGDYAAVYFVMALALAPDLDVARSLWADTLDSAGRRGDAIAVLSQIAPDSPFYATAQGQLAWALRREGRNDEALDVATRALAAQPDRDLMVQLGDLFTTLERDGEADTVFTDVIAFDAAKGTPDWRIYWARGAARERMGRWPEAEADLREAMRLSPDNPSVLNHLGYGLVDRGLKLREGMRLISRAVDLNPRSGMIVDSLGWAYFKLGDYDRSVMQLERAVELEPGDPTINDHLGDAYWKVGRRLEARFQWQRALSLGPEPERVDPINEKIAVGLIDAAPVLTPTSDRADP